MSEYSLSELCQVIQDAERRAAELMLHAHGILAEAKTGRRDVVTEYDRRIQTLLTGLLREAVPEAHFFCEEMNEQESLDAEHLFIIDPIDGTMNFVHGLHHSCISIAYAERGVTKIGVIFNPYVDEMFSAVSGEGAALNGNPIRVTDAALSESVACFGTAPYSPELIEPTISLARSLLIAGLDLRREGSAALDLCSVAAGRAGIYAELQVSLWDYAAGELIVREAGGLCSAADGGPLPSDGSKTSIAAGGPAAWRDFLNLTSAARRTS